MKRIHPLARAAILAAALAVVPRAAAAAPGNTPGLDDRRATEHLAAMERQGVATDPFWAEAYRARARTAPTPSARVADLRWALRFDPDCHGARRELAGALFREGDPEFAGQLATLVRRASSGFPSQQWILHVLISVLVPALAVGLAVFALLAVGKSVPRIHHALRERLHFLPVEVREGAALLTLLLPLVLALTLPPTAAIFWCILLGTVGTWKLLDRWERRLGIVALAVILVTPFGLAAWTRVTVPSFPDAYLRCLWVVQGADDPAAAGVVRAARPAAADRDGDWHATLALMDRRAGRWSSAADRLEQAIALAPARWSYHNNLGNVRLLAGDADGALEAYGRALALDPRAAVVHVNRAQAWVRKLQFTKADADVRRAGELGYHFPRLLDGNDDDLVLRDHRLDSGGIWSRLARGEGLEGGLPWPRAAGISLGILFPLAPAPLSLLLYLAIGYAALARGLHRTFHCASCSRLVSRKSHFRVHRRSLCATCYSLRQTVKAPLEREAAIAARRTRVRRIPRTLGMILSALVPGTGHVLAGMPRRGGLALVTAAALAAFALGTLRWGPLGAPLGEPHAPGVVLGLVGFLYVSLASLSVRRYRSAPAPGSEPPPAAPGRTADEPPPLPRSA